MLVLFACISEAQRIELSRQIILPLALVEHRVGHGVEGGAARNAQSAPVGAFQVQLEQPLLSKDQREPGVRRKPHPRQLFFFLVAVDAAPERLLIRPEDEPDTLVELHAGVHQRLDGKQGGQQRPLVVLRAAAVQHSHPLLNRIKRSGLPVLQFAGRDDVQVPQDADHLRALADLGVTVVPAVAVVRAEPQVAGDLQGFPQRLIDGRAERIAALPLRAHAGDAHQLAEGGLQRRVLGCQVLG